jgi:thiol:disulfide interchange protein DsbD
MMGFMLLAAAAYFGAGRIISGLQFWWAVVAVVAVASLYLIARTVQLSKNPSAIAFSSVLAVAMLGGTSWWTVTVTGGGDWEAFSEQRFAAVRAEGKPVLVKFTANWCGTCQAIEGTVFRNAKVWKSLKEHGVTAFKVDFSTDSNAPGKSLLLSLNPTGGIPVTAIFGLGSGHDPTVFESFYTSDDLLKVLDATKSSSPEVSPALSSSTN